MPQQRCGAILLLFFVFLLSGCAVDDVPWDALATSAAVLQKGRAPAPIATLAPTAGPVAQLPPTATAPPPLTPVVMTTVVATITALPSPRPTVTLPPTWTPALARATLTPSPLPSASPLPSPSSSATATATASTTPSPEPTAPLALATPAHVVDRAPIVMPDSFTPGGNTISSLLYGTSYWVAAAGRPWPTPVELLLTRNRISMLRLGASSAPLAHINAELDRFIALCRQLGAEPLIQVELLGGSAAEAARVVRYANVERGYNVRFWAVGNEPDFWSELGLRPGYDVQTFSEEWRALATAMKEVDPSIWLVGPDYGTRWRAFDGNEDWITPFLQRNADLLDVLAVHYYATIGAPSMTVAQLLDHGDDLDARLAALAAQAEAVTGRTMPLAVTEFNVTSAWADAGDVSATSYWAGLWAADTYGRLINNNIYIGLFWSAYGGGLSLLDNHSQPRATFHAQGFYSDFGSVRLDAWANHRDLAVYAAAVPETGYVTIVLLNRGASGGVATLRFAPGGGDIVVNLRRDVTFTQELTPFSMTSLVFDDQLQLVRTMHYDKALWDAGLVPTITLYP